MTNCGKLKAYACRGVAQPGSAPALGAGGPEFKSRRPDQNISRVFFSILKAPFTSTSICGILADRSLLSARIPQMEVEVNGAFNMLKKTREMFWSGRRDLNSGPPAPKAGALPGCATPRHCETLILPYFSNRSFGVVENGNS